VRTKSNIYTTTCGDLFTKDRERNAQYIVWKALPFVRKYNKGICMFPKVACLCHSV